MSAGARVILWGMLLVAGAIAARVFVDWGNLLDRFPHYLRPLRAAVRAALHLSLGWAYGVPVMLAAVAVFRLATARAGRGVVFLKLVVFAVLWAAGSVAFFFGLFLAYAPGMGQGGTALLAPALLACIGYMLVGVGFVASLVGRR